MALPNTSPQNKQSGFTLVEMAITLALLAVMFSFGLSVSFDFYKSYSLHSQINILVSVLQKARAQSLNNINQAAHGVHIENSSPLRYVMFECPPNSANCAYVKNPLADITVDASYGVALAGPMPPDVVFEPLSGNCVSSVCVSDSLTITIQYEQKSYTILVNSQGRIDWQ